MGSKKPHHKKHSKKSAAPKGAAAPSRAAAGPGWLDRLRGSRNGSVYPICADLSLCCPPAEGRAYYDYGLFQLVQKSVPRTEDEYHEVVYDDEDDDLDETYIPAPPINVQPAAIIEKQKGLLEAKFDECQGTMSIEMAGRTAREMGLAPSLADLEKLEKDAGGGVTRPVFEAWLKRIGHSEDSAKLLTQFFEYFDQGKTGSLTRAQLFNLLQTHGEPVAEDEISRWLSRVYPHDQSRGIEYGPLIENTLRDAELVASGVAA